MKKKIVREGRELYFLPNKQFNSWKCFYKNSVHSHLFSYLFIYYFALVSIVVWSISASGSKNRTDLCDVEWQKICHILFWKEILVIFN